MLPLDGCDMVLGAQWLRTLGHILWDFSNLKMEFAKDGQKYRLMGSQPNSLKVVSSHAMERIMHQDSSGVLFYVCQLHAISEINGMNQEIKDIIDQYEDIFEEPKQLRLK